MSNLQQLRQTKHYGQRANTTMKISGVFLLVLAVFCCRRLAAICPPGWQEFGESCYAGLPGKASWRDANDSCSELQATLAVPNSKAENYYIWGFFEPKVDMWLGCSDLDMDGNWTCLFGGESSGFQNWGINQPDGNKGEGKPVCACTTGSKTWDDRPCGKGYRAVCKRPVRHPGFCLETGRPGRLIAPSV